MYKSIDKVIAEYIFTFTSPGLTVKGRITEKLGAGLGSAPPFSWSLSHYYKVSKEALGINPPSKTECGSKEEAERLMFSYVRTFTDIVEPNRFY